MAMNALKENLPWMVPSVAIVLAAMGFFDRSPQTQAQAPQPAIVAAEPQTSTAALATATAVTAPAREPSAALEPAAATEPTPASASTTEAKPDVRSEAALTEALQQKETYAEQPEQVETSQQDEGAPATIELTAAAVQTITADIAQATSQQQQLETQKPQATVEEQPQQVSLPSASDNPDAFFKAAQANLASAQSCVNDVRSLADITRIYFPSGGLTAAAEGIAQARTLGMVAQSCPSVMVQVEGHSDPSGNPQINLALSQQRAESVIKRLGATGFDTSKFIAKGFGDTRPSRETGPEGRAYYDRRVEFSVIELDQQAAAATSRRTTPLLTSCTAQLAAEVAQTKLYYAPGAVTVTADEMQQAYRLAEIANDCPQARLRVIGQFSGQPGAGESPSTGRLRAAVVMSKIVGQGYSSDQVIIAGQSRPGALPGQPSISERRVDFDIILE
ncbi:MAG: OmpA family protein [Pseudomonadota bacterium]